MNNLHLVFFCSVALLAPGLNAQSMRVAYTATEGMDYRLEASTDLQQWLPISEFVTGTGQEVAASIPSQAKQFFRLQIRSPYHLRNPIAPSVSLADLAPQCNAETWRATAMEVLARRYPEAKEMMQDLSDPNFFNFWFGGGTSYQDVVTRVSGAVHESVHSLGGNRISYGPDGWVRTLCLGNDQYYSSPDRTTFPRSEVVNWLPEELKTSGYASTYLAGQSGGQGFMITLDEVNAYTISSLVDTAVVDQFPPGMSTSSRDGLLSLMLFAQLYLKAARIDHPAEYMTLRGDRKLVQLIVLLMDRADYALSLSGTDPRLGLQDGVIRPYAIQNSGEVDALRSMAYPKLGIDPLQ